MLRPSFVPPAAIRRGRGFTRARADPVHERTAELGLVTPLVHRAARAGGSLAVGPAARTGVGGQHQLEARREAHRPLGPGQHDLSGLQRLPQRLQDLAEDPHGIFDCTHCFQCIEVCPKEVAPMSQIMRLRRAGTGAWVRRIFGGTGD